MIPSGLAAEGQQSSSLDVSDIRGLLSAARPELQETSDEYRAAVLLLAGPSLSFNIDRLARRTRYARQFVAMCTRRLFDNAVWRHEGAIYSWDTPSDERFWRDVEVAVGRSYRRCGADGTVEWGLVTTWRKKYDFGQDPEAPISTVYLSDAEIPLVAIPEPEVEEPIVFERQVPEIAPQRPIKVTVLPTIPVPAIAGGNDMTTPMAAAALHDSMMELFPGVQWL